MNGNRWSLERSEDSEDGAYVDILMGILGRAHPVVVARRVPFDIAYNVAFHHNRTIV